MQKFRLLDVVQKLESDPVPHYWLKEFIHGFDLPDTDEERQALVAEEPLFNRCHFVKEGVDFTSVLIAGMVEEICQRYQIPASDWTEKPEHFLAAPLITTSNPEVVKIYLADTPEPYRNRNPVSYTPLTPQPIYSE